MLAAMKKSKTQLSMREIFGQNLRRARRLKDISQEELALRSELSRTYVSEVERGIRNVSIDNMDILSHALGISLSELVNPEMFAAIQGHLD
ncbi:MAG: helix-turn-helix transcriptional regulator [Undibacterium umbellatum]|uniref:helix-turn-helix domain-containing protein n=1 Tax=Undibacterium umbellatum TaxID=2762300 RepID=UPI003BB62F47